MSCKSTYISETNRWHRNQARLERLSLEYQNFEPALQKQLAEARSIYEKAKFQSAEEIKKETINQANRLASGGYIYQLDTWEVKVEKLRLDAIQLFEYADKHKDFVIAGMKADNIEIIIDDMKDYLVSIVVSDKYQAEQVVSKAVGKLNRIQKVIADNFNEIEKRKKAESEKTAIK